MNTSTTIKFISQHFLVKRLFCTSNVVFSASFSPNDFIEGPPLNEEIPQKEPKYIHEMVGRKRKNRIVYGSGMCSTGALAIEKLLTFPSLTQCLWQPMRIVRMNTKNIKFIAAGCGFSLFASNNELYGSGLNNFYQLSGPKRSDEDERPNLEYGYAGRNEAEMWYIHGRKIVLPENIGNIRGICAGRMHSVLLTDTNKIFCFGSNSHGQCGADPLVNPVVTHDKGYLLHEMDISSIVEEGCEIVKVHASLDTTFALTSNGKLFAWGLGTDGQLGNGNTHFQWKPTLVLGDLEGEKIVEVGGSTDTIVAVNSDGALFIWGQNEYGQMCSITDEPQIFFPQQVPFKLGKVVGAEATGVSCIVCNSEGDVFTWGSHVLGFGPKIERLTKPMQIDRPLFTSAMNEKNGVVKVFAGGSCMGALTERGHLFTWGSNRHGILALCHRNHQYFPFQVSFAECIKDVSFGPNHSTPSRLCGICQRYLEKETS
ncbi:Fe2OG dioxygenase domain-containing protein [Meloidogyne graminicola]|uniref:Fe2OG dioxygenase domain-containing protein n=1 Tax=Meloidogyne graminicola TaxID=189291 RepID=A0A8S9ZRU4_9BILA|nr:Fe2OG dioxygenase domain-containing protein [Meloidogyne graminicola]